MQDGRELRVRARLDVGRAAHDHLGDRQAADDARGHVADALGDELAVAGRDALLRVVKEGPVQQIRPIEIGGGKVPGCDRVWPLFAGDKPVGQVTSAAWSPDYDTNVAIGMVRMTHWDAGTELRVETPDGARDALVKEAFWA